ncbi:MAG: Gfo/Idh/MocA family protein [Christensenellales bacterium]|jgi:predicted dehydrogenase
MRNGKILIGQIGIGHNHAAAKMEAFRSLDTLFEVAGVVAESQEWLKKRGGLPAYRDIPFMTEEALLNMPGLDAVAVETDVWDMLATARRCAVRGLHIHLDKPAGTDLAEYRMLLDSVKTQNLAFQLGYMYRYNPAVRYCIEAVKRGELGEIFSVDAMMSTEHSPEYRTWLNHFPGGTMYIFGCHLIDLILQIQGPPEEVVPFLQRTGFNSVDAYDSTLAVFRYSKGASLVRVSSVEVNGWGRRQLVICGEKGTLEMKPMERPTLLTRSYAGGDAYNDVREVIMNRNFHDKLGRYDDQLRDFAAFILEKKENPYSPDYEWTLQKILLEACAFGKGQE